MAQETENEIAGVNLNSGPANRQRNPWPASVSTTISTVPTYLQRQGIFTEAIGGRVPALYDPATTAAVGPSSEVWYCQATVPSAWKA